MIRYLPLFVFALVLSAPSLAAFAGPFELVPTTPTQRQNVALKRVDDKFLDQATFAGIHTAVRYKLEAEPDMEKGFHSRIDSYEINKKGGGALDLLQHIDTPIGFNFHNGMHLLFARQFHSPDESRSARAYGLAELPLTSATARNLQAGDFVSFTNHMDVLLSASLGISVLGPIKILGGTHVAVSGDFLVQVYRLPGNRARVRLLAIQTKAKEGEFGVGYGLPLTLIGINTSLINDLTIFSIKAVNEQKQGVFSLLDYVYDLSSPEAADAYDRLMNGNVKLATIRSQNPLDQKRIKAILFSDTSASESLADADLSRDAVRRVERMDQTRATFQSRHRGVKINLGLLSVDSGTTTSSNKVIRENAQGVSERFVFNTFTPASYVKILFGLIKEDELHSMRTLMESDENFRPRDFRALSFVNERRVSVLRSSHLDRLRSDLSNTLPAGSLSDLTLERTGDKSPKNGFLRTEIAFNPSAFRQFRKPDPRALSPRLRRFFAQQDLSNQTPVFAPNSSGEAATFANCAQVECYERDFDEMAPLISVVADSRASVPAREGALRQLMHFSLFRSHGASILLGLLPAGNRAPLVRAEVLVTATGMRPYLLDQGQDPDGLLANLEEVHEEIYGKPFANPFK